jgi:isocitrate dehydrogenase
MSPQNRITLAFGDGIGTDILRATLFILLKAKVQFEVEPICIGEKVYQRGIASGIDEMGWDSVRRTRIFLKPPIIIPSENFHDVSVVVREKLKLHTHVLHYIEGYPITADQALKDIVVIHQNSFKSSHGLSQSLSSETANSGEFT